MYIFWRCESLECLSAPRWQTQSHKFQRTSVNRSRGAHNKSHGKRFRHFYPQKGTLGHTFGFLTFHLASTKFLRHLLKIIYHFPEFSEWNFGKTTTTFLWLKVLSNRFYGHLKFFGGRLFRNRNLSKIVEIPREDPYQVGGWGLWEYLNIKMPLMHLRNVWVPALQRFSTFPGHTPHWKPIKVTYGPIPVLLFLRQGEVYVKIALKAWAVGGRHRGCNCICLISQVRAGFRATVPICPCYHGQLANGDGHICLTIMSGNYRIGRKFALHTAKNVAANAWMGGRSAPAVCE